MGHTHDKGLEGHAGHGESQQGWAQEDGSTAQASGGHMADANRQQAHEEQQRSQPHEGERGSDSFSRCGLDNRQGNGFWSDHIWLAGADGKSRRSQPGLPLLAYGVSNRVGRLRAYGNAIVPQLAAEVIKAFLEATEAA
jgi:DNA (cytosine-5)-methyltransferase 1